MFDQESYPGGGMLGAMLRARQLFSLIQNAQYTAEDRKFRQEDRQRDIANEKRAQEFQDFNARMKLQDEGAVQQTDALARLTSVLGQPSSHTLMQTPVGAQYLPTQETQRSTALKDLMAKANATAVGKLNEQQLLMPGEVEKAGKEATAREAAKQKTQPRYKLTPEVAEALGKTEATADEIDSFVKQHNASNPNLHLVKDTDDSGNVSVTAINPRTFERVGTIPLGQVGKSKTQPQSKPVNVLPRMSEFERERKKAQTLFNKAQLFEQAGETDKAEAARKEAEDQLSYATQLATNLAQAYPDQVEGGPGDADQGGHKWPYLKMKQGGAPSAASPQPASAAAGPKVYPASKLAALAKKRKKDVNAVRKELTASGYQIDEKN